MPAAIPAAGRGACRSFDDQPLWLSRVALAMGAAGKGGGIAELRLDLQGCQEAAASCAMGIPCQGGFSVADTSPAFLRNVVLIPGGLGLCPGPAAAVGQAAGVCPPHGLAPTWLQEAADP